MLVREDGMNFTCNFPGRNIDGVFDAATAGLPVHCALLQLLRRQNAAQGLSRLLAGVTQGVDQGKCRVGSRLPAAEQPRSDA